MTIFGWAVGLYAGASALAYFGHRAVMYPAPGRAVEPVLEDAELSRIPGRGGRTVFALYSKAPEGAPTIVHFHGNGEELADQAWLAAALRRGGVGVLAVEYPGYGLARDHKPNEQDIYDDAETAIRYLQQELEVPKEKIVLQGQSLGTGVATEMAARGFGSKLVLISPFTSMVAMARRVLPILPMRVVIRDKYDSLGKASRISVPALVVHGASDDLIPISMGRRMAEALGPAKLVEVAAAGHNDLFERDGRRIVSEITEFALAP